MSWGSAYSPDFRVESTVGAGTGTNAANDRRLVEIMPGTSVTFVADSIDTGRYAARCDVGAGSRYIGLSLVATTPRYSGAMCRFKITSAALTTDLRIIYQQAGIAAQGIRLKVNASTGLLAYSFDNGSTYTNSATAVTVGTVYRLECFADFNGTTHTLKVRLDGVEVINATASGRTSTTALEPLFGSDASAASMIVDYADLVTYNDAAQYGTLTDWRVVGLEPVADGTHSFTDNDFKDAAGTAITAANVAAMNTWDMVNDAPGAAPSTTDFVQQVVIRGTSYMEWRLRALPLGYGAPVLVCLAAAMHPVAGTTANAFQFRLASGVNASSETAIDTSIASNTLEYRKHHYPLEPGGAAWTAAMAKAPLRVRAGYDGTNVTAPPALDAVMAFLVVPVDAIVNGTAASTSASTGSAAGVASNHLVSGTAASTSASAGTATGAATPHLYTGTAASTSPSTGSAAGTATRHQYAGAAASASASSSAAAGVASPHLTLATAASTSPSSATAVGTGAHHDYEGSATSTSLSQAAAAGVASPHQYEGTADSTSASDATAVGIVTVPIVTGRAGGQTWREVHYPRFGIAESTSRSSAHALGTVSIGRRDREDENAALLLELGFVG